jgi:hypothetical protein
MPHITVNVLLVLLGVTAFVALGIGMQAGRREAGNRQRKLEAEFARTLARIERQETWHKRKESVVEKLTPWRRRGD